MESTKYDWCCVAFCAMVSMLLAGCTNTEPSTLISSVGNSYNYNSSGHAIINPINNSIIMASLPTFIVDLNQYNCYCESSNKNSGSKMFNTACTAVINTTSPVAASIMTVTHPSNTPITNWCWPTDGKIIDDFSTATDGNKGMDIAGYLGQPILATANGKVVYAGNALRGYGNLIIIKHNDDYLSAYAHNNTILVYEQQNVIFGQKIATMGSTGTNNIRLHFELRYKGNSVNPLFYLQQR